MQFYSLPKWVNIHLYNKKSFSQLSQGEIFNLKTKLEKFQIADPDVSIVIPAYNEENNIYRTLSSLANNRTSLKVEIVVVNNKSTDQTQKVLDTLGVKNYFQPLQGIAYARQRGLEVAKGKYHLCADADTIYPPEWIELMIRPMINNNTIVGVYGRYSILPPNEGGRFGLWVYEKLTGILFRIRKQNREHINVLGFNMGFNADLGRAVRGFEVGAVRKFDNAKGSSEYTEISEDGNMAFELKKLGKLKMITAPKARVYTSARKLLQDGSISNAMLSRVKRHGLNMLHYFFPNYIKWV